MGIYPNRNERNKFLFTIETRSYPEVGKSIAYLFKDWSMRGNNPHFRHLGQFLKTHRRQGRVAIFRSQTSSSGPENVWPQRTIGDFRHGRGLRTTGFQTLSASCGAANSWVIGNGALAIVRFQSFTIGDGMSACTHRLSERCL